MIGSGHPWGWIVARYMSRFVARCTPGRRGARGQILMIAALLLPILLGMAGLAIDIGLVASLRRDTQNVADGAALAGGGVLLDGGTVASAKTTAAGYVTAKGYACPNAVCVNIPPASGPHTGDSRYVEVSLSGTRNTVFMRAIGRNAYTVTSRAVAETVLLPKNYALIVLNNLCAPNNGSTAGTATYQQNTSGGGLTIAGGGAAINSACEPSANLGGTSRLTADFIDYNSDGLWQQSNNATTSPAPTKIGAPVPDPLASLTPPLAGWPSASCGGCTAANPALASISGGGNVTLNPGTYYGGLKISGNGGGTVTFQPGTYVFAGGGFEYSGNKNLDGSQGVTFYNTDDPSAVQKQLQPCASMKITGSGTVVLNAPTTGPNTNMLFWQDKNCTADFDYAGSTNTTTSIIYAPNARLNLSGGGTLGANQVIVGSIDFNGSASITINYGTGVQADEPKARLVE